jgi:hypothetical protein
MNKVKIKDIIMKIFASGILVMEVVCYMRFLMYMNLLLVVVKF